VREDVRLIGARAIQAGALRETFGLPFLWNANRVVTSQVRPMDRRAESLGCALAWDIEPLADKVSCPNMNGLEPLHVEVWFDNERASTILTARAPVPDLRAAD
jgi:hypothetical protein